MKIVIITIIITATTAAMIAEEPQQITQGQVTNMVLDELQHRSNEAFYYHNAVQGAECAAIDRISGVDTSNIENGSDHADMGKALAVSDFKIEDVPNERWRTYTPGFIQAFVDFGDWISGIFE